MAEASMKLPTHSSCADGGVSRGVRYSVVSDAATDDRYALRATALVGPAL